MRNRNRWTAKAALTTIAAAAAFATMAAAGPARSQIWLVGTVDLSGLRYVSLDSGHRSRHTNTRSYYRASRTVPLGAIAEETAMDSRAAWQARLSRDARKVGVQTTLTPMERHEDQINAETERWHNDPTHW